MRRNGAFWQEDSAQGEGLDRGGEGAGVWAAIKPKEIAASQSGSSKGSRWNWNRCPLPVRCHQCEYPGAISGATPTLGRRKCTYRDFPGSS